jgi:hypothetical protein
LFSVRLLREGRLWLPNRFLDRLDPDPMVRNLTVEDVFAQMLGSDQAG